MAVVGLGASTGAIAELMADPDFDVTVFADVVGNALVPPQGQPEDKEQ